MKKFTIKATVAALVALLTLVSVTTKLTASEFNNLCQSPKPVEIEGNFHIISSAANKYLQLPVKLGCPPNGKGVSLPIEWTKLPDGTTHLHLTVMDSSCTYECNSCCQYHHWVLDLPIKEFKDNKIAEGSWNTKKMLQYIQPNTSNKKEYMPFCPPHGEIHSYLIRGVAYKMKKGKKVVLGYAQSAPMLYSTDPKAFENAKMNE